MVIIRIGEGRIATGKILERDTHYYTIDEKEDAIEDVINTGRQYRIYISRHNKKYEHITFDELKEL